LADSLYKINRKELKNSPWHIEGEENAEWILLDYVDVVVHIFSDEMRDFYKLEELWADAKTTKHNE
jgi:ribosome-associated protein